MRRSIAILSVGSLLSIYLAAISLTTGSATITLPSEFTEYTLPVDGGSLNLFGNQVTLGGSISGSGSLSVFGTYSGARLTLTGTNTMVGLEINAVRVSASSVSNLGTGSVNLNGGGTLELTQSGAYSLPMGLDTLGGSVDVGAGKLVVWNGSLSGLGDLTKTGSGALALRGTSSTFSGSLKVSAGSLSLGSGTTTWSGGSGSINLSSGVRMDILSAGTLDLRDKLNAMPTSSVYWNGSDSSSILKLNTTVPYVYNIGAGSISLGVSNKSLIYVNGHYYQPLAPGLAVGTPVYVDAEGPLLNATQRSLGYREVAYKKLFFAALGLTSGTVTADLDGNTVYNYGTRSTSTDLAGYWTNKNLPIILGPDGNGYITDGHHTTAGYLESSGAVLAGGSYHLVLGTVVSNPSSEGTVSSQFWQDLQASNNAYLYGPTGNQLIQPGEVQGSTSYEGLQAIVAGALGGAAMPTTPGKASMVNDLYRSLTWGMADGIVKSAANISGSKIKGFSKSNPYSSTGADVNFVEFFWGDFLRNRVLWKDDAAVTSANLINAPVSFFAAVANGIALGKSELYRDQFGRNITDYTNPQFAANTVSWANATLKNGLAASGDTYKMFLTDDVAINGDIIPSGLDGVTNTLYINTGTSMTVAGALQNFYNIAVNTGTSITIDWKDSAVNAVPQNKTLSIPAGTGNVEFQGDNDYSKLAYLKIGAGTLTLNTARQSADQTLFADISGPGALVKKGVEKLTLAGASSFSGGLGLEEGVLVLGSPSVSVDGILLSSPVGTGSISMNAGSTLGFDESLRLPNSIRISAGTLSEAFTKIDLGDNAVEFAGTVNTAVPLSVLGSSGSVLILSGSGSLSADISVQGSLLRLSGAHALEGGTLNLRAGGGIQAGSNQVLSLAIVVEDEARLDGGESILTINGDVSGYGALRMTGHPAGTVRLGGVNTYTGGTTVEGTRVDVAVNSADDSSEGLSGSGRVFGTGAVRFNNATLGFLTSAQIPNSVVLDSELTVDVGSNTGELSGLVSGSSPGAGGIYVKGNSDGVLFLSGAGNSYGGLTMVEGTTLRLFHTADTAVLGTGTQSSGALFPLGLNNARLQIVADYRDGALASLTPVTARGITLGALGGTLGATDVSLNWSGVISGGTSVEPAKLSVTGSKGTQVELSALNTYTGGTDVGGGVVLKITGDGNLGLAGTKVSLDNSGLFYGSAGTATFERALSVAGDALLDMGERTLTLSGSLTGAGNLEIGRVSGASVWAQTDSTTTGTLVIGSSASEFTGRTVLVAGTLQIAGKNALRNSVLEVNANNGVLYLTDNEASFGGLSGTGNLAVPSVGTLTVGFKGEDSRFTGVLSGGSLSLVKVGAGNLTLAGQSTFTGAAKVQEGVLTLEASGDLLGSKISLGSNVRLVINGNGVGRDFGGKFDSVDKSSTVVFNGSETTEILQLPESFAGQALSLGKGLVIVGSVSTSVASGPVIVGAGGGSFNLFGNQMTIGGSISGTGALTVFGTSAGARVTLTGTNTMGGLEIDGVRVVASSAANLGTGSVNLNGGGTLELTQSGSYGVSMGVSAGGGKFEVGSGNLVVWNGSLGGAGDLSKTGAGVLALRGTSSAFSGSLNVSSGSLFLGSVTSAWSGGSAGINLATGARLDVFSAGTLDLRGKLTANPTSSVYWNGADSSSVLKLNTTIPYVYNLGAGSISLGVSNKTLIYVNGHYYQPLVSGLAVGTPVYVDAEGPLLNATQRSLGYREVAYKKLFFTALGLTGATVGADLDGNTVYNYGTRSTSTDLAGYWTNKNLPIILGPDGKGYITDGHHTTAGYLESTGAQIAGGSYHLVLGTVVSNPSSQSTVNSQFWQDLQASNNAYLYGPTGNQLIQPGEAQGSTGYEGLQPVVAGTLGGAAMPTTPGKASMVNDLYRSLTWGMADGIVKTASNISGSKIKGFNKTNPYSPTGADVNFIEFYWGDFLRNRVLWNDDAAVTSANLINAPVSFFAAVANGIALGKSESYRDQFGRNITDYTNPQFSDNTVSWANATLKNGLAASGDTYKMFLTDDVSINGDIIPSGLDGVTNHLYINTGSSMTVPGALQNFYSISVNTGASITIDWKDSAVNSLTQNKTLAIPAGTGNVEFQGDNDYLKLAYLTIGAGTLTFNTSKQTADQTLFADISGAGAFRKTGQEKLTLTGANSFSGGLFLDEGVLVLGSPSVSVGGALVSSAAGTGSISLKAGSTLGFDESMWLPNNIRIGGGTFSEAPTSLNIGDNAVELAGTLEASVPLNVRGSASSVLILSGAGTLASDVSVQASLIRLSGLHSIAGGTISLRAGAGIQAGSNQVVSSAMTLEDEARLDGGESILTINGDISGDGALRITGHPGGTVRLGGINSYTGGTTVEGTRVDVAVNSADENSSGPLGAGRVFGTGAVRFTNATMGFFTAAQVPNTLLLDNELTVDVGSNTGEVSGTVSDSFSATGGLYVKGNSDGVLFLSSPNNSYSGLTIVDGTTLRLLHTADTSVLGAGTQSSGALHPLVLNNARLQIIANYREGATVSATPLTTRGIRIGGLGGTIDATDVSLDWSGVISGGSEMEPAKLSVSGSKGTQVELSAANTYTGGTDVTGGVLLKVTADSNVGAAGTKVILENAGLYYAGLGEVTFGRPLAVLGDSLLDMGARTLSLTGSLSGTGNLEVGRVARSSVWAPTESTTSGTLVMGSSASEFKGRTVLVAGTLKITSTTALRNSALEVNSSNGVMYFTGNEVSLGALSGVGNLAVPSAGTLFVGYSGDNSRFSGSLSGGSLSLVKVGTGNLTLAGMNTFTGTTRVQEGLLTLDAGGDVFNSSISLGSKVRLVINGVGRDLSAKFGSVEPDSIVVFNGSGASEILQLPENFAAQTLNLGKGFIKVGTAAASSGSSIGGGAVVALESIQSTVTLSGGTLSLSSQSGTPLVLSGTSSLRSTRSSDVVEIKSGDSVKLTSGFPTTVEASGARVKSFEGVFKADGVITVTPENTSVQLEIPTLKGSGSLSLTSGTAKLNDSPDFVGTTSLGSGASAVLTGSLGTGGRVVLSSGAKLSVVPESLTKEVSVPALSGAGDVALSAGKIVLTGGNSLFTGSISVGAGVEVTVKGDLPSGTVRLVDPSVPLKVDTSSGNINLPGTVRGEGALALGGSGTITMGSGAKIETAVLKVGGAVGDKPTLDVSSLSGGVLSLSSAQTLGGGGTVVGSVVTTGIFTPGNSPGDFTVSSKTSGSGVSGGNLTIGAGGSVLIEYGKEAATGTIKSDTVTVAGTLTLDPTASIKFSKYVATGTWNAFTAPAVLSLPNVFAAKTINSTSGVTLSADQLASMISLDGPSLFTKVTATSLATSGSLSFQIARSSYATLVPSASGAAVAGYLFMASQGSSNAALSKYLDLLDASTTPAQVQAYVGALRSPVFAEAQRLSLRRTAAISETLQSRLVQGTHQSGWSAWSESYGWSFHKTGSGDSAAWQGQNYGEVLGVENTNGALTLGFFGATGALSASFSEPNTSLKGDNFHGGAYARLESGQRFIDASFLAGSAEQKAERFVVFGPLGGKGSAKFNTSEYAAHVRMGLVIPEAAKGLSLKPSFAVLLNGYSQGGASESGLEGVGVTTDKVTGSAWQTRLGTEASKAFKVAGKAADLSASVYWVRDASKGARSANTKFNGSNVAGYSASGEAVGANAVEIGLGAGVDLSKRTSARLNGVWQVREGSSQPGFNLGLTVKF